MQESLYIKLWAELWAKPWAEWREDREHYGLFCPEGATGLSPGFQPWEPAPAQAP
jgi:hypothetical protein